jgi:hypothetical protein
MSSRLGVALLLPILSGAALVALHAAGESEQQADAFSKKLAIVTQRGASGARGDTRGPQRTPFAEVEVNSWFAYRSREMLPAGVTDPRVTIVGDGRLRGAATVDLDVIAKRRSTGRTLDPWAYLGGRVPVTLSGVLHTQNGTGRFELEEAAVSGVSVPPSVLQDIVAYYSKTADDPDGVRLNEPFKLPAQIKQIEVGRGQAVVVQ